jgi:hypothetical protein
LEVLEEDMLRVIEESRVSRKVLVTFNATFIALIPKLDNPSTFEEFKPISLCKCIYKIVVKIIVGRVKNILSTTISNEKFGFLKGRKIHEAIGVPQ